MVSSPNRVASLEEEGDQYKKENDPTIDFLFDQYDSNADGEIDQYEFTLFLWDLKNGQITKEQSYKCWELVDFEKRGLIKKSEFRKGIEILWEYDFLEGRFHPNESDEAVIQKYLLDKRLNFKNVNISDDEEEMELKIKYIENQKILERKKEELKEVQEILKRETESQRSDFEEEIFSALKEDVQGVLNRASFKRAESLKIFSGEKEKTQMMKKVWSEARAKSELDVTKISEEEEYTPDTATPLSSGGGKPVMVRVYYTDPKSYKSILASEFTTVEQITEKAFSKYEIPEAESSKLCLFECPNNSIELKKLNPSSVITSIDLNNCRIFIQSKTATILESEANNIPRRNSRTIFSKRTSMKIKP